MAQEDVAVVLAQASACAGNNIDLYIYFINRKGKFHGNDKMYFISFGKSDFEFMCFNYLITGFLI